MTMYNIDEQLANYPLHHLWYVKPNKGFSEQVSLDIATINTPDYYEDEDEYELQEREFVIKRHNILRLKTGVFLYYFVVLPSMINSKLNRYKSIKYFRPVLYGDSLAEQNIEIGTALIKTALIPGDSFESYLSLLRANNTYLFLSTFAIGIESLCGVFSFEKKSSNFLLDMQKFQDTDFLQGVYLNAGGLDYGQFISIGFVKNSLK